MLQRFIAWWEHDETEDAEREVRVLLEMEHVGSFYICSISEILLLPSASDGSRDTTLHQVRSHWGR